MQDLNDLYYFVQVVDHGGFAAAARATGLQKSKLSRRIQQLEDRLQVRLINRSSRRFSVTEIGREFYERCLAMLVEAEAAEQVVAEVQAAPRGTIRIACPVALVQFQFGALLASFMAEYPEVSVQLESTNRRVDLIAEGLDIAIRVRFPPLTPTDLVMRQLDESTQHLVASPALLATLSHLPVSPADLHGLPSLDGTTQGDHRWTFRRDTGEEARIVHRPRLITDDMAALRNAALAGVGVVQLPSMLIWDDLAAGRLVHLLPEWQIPAAIVHAVFPSRRGLLPSVRALLDHLVAGCTLMRAAGETAAGA